MAFLIKRMIACFFSVCGISNVMLHRLNTKYGHHYIRVINYHDTKEIDRDIFEAHLKWYRKEFINIDYPMFQKFMEGEMIPGDKPGIMLTFDDGLKGNYDIAFPLLEKYSFTGYFLCSSDLVGTDGYMTESELVEMAEAGHVIGDHTATHHRMEESDTDELLSYEVTESKWKLERMIGESVDIFCWCGGEEEHYTKKAYEKIKQTGYRYVFMTNSAPLTHDMKKLHIQRINVEAGWPMNLVKLQLCGFMDRHFKDKRLRVDRKLAGDDREAK